MEHGTQPPSVDDKTFPTDVAGLPALPALSIGFLVPNADLIWAQLRRRGWDGR